MLFMESSAKDHALTSEVFYQIIQIFNRLATEVIRRIECGEIDPKNEAFGVKLGGYQGGKTETKGRLCC